MTALYSNILFFILIRNMNVKLVVLDEILSDLKQGETVNLMFYNLKNALTAFSVTLCCYNLYILYVNLSIYFSNRLQYVYSKNVTFHIILPLKIRASFKDYFFHSNMFRLFHIQFLFFRVMQTTTI